MKRSSCESKIVVSSRASTQILIFLVPLSCSLPLITLLVCQKCPVNYFWLISHSSPALYMLLSSINLHTISKLAMYIPISMSLLIYLATGYKRMADLSKFYCVAKPLKMHKRNWPIFSKKSFSKRA